MSEDRIDIALAEAYEGGLSAAKSRIAELEAQLADANEMLEKCNSKFIVALEAEVTRLKAAMDEYSENEMLLIERCAKVCERQGKERGECPEMPEYCADAIRAMIAE